MDEFMLCFSVGIIGDTYEWLSEKYNELLNILSLDKIRRVHQTSYGFVIYLDNIVIVGLIWPTKIRGYRFDRLLISKAVDKDEFNRSMFRSKCGLRTFEFIN